MHQPSSRPIRTGAACHESRQIWAVIGPPGRLEPIADGLDIHQNGQRDGRVFGLLSPLIPVCPPDLVDHFCLELGLNVDFPCRQMLHRRTLSDFPRASANRRKHAEHLRASCSASWYLELCHTAPERTRDLLPSRRPSCLEAFLRFSLRRQGLPHSHAFARIKVAFRASRRCRFPLHDGSRLDLESLAAESGGPSIDARSSRRHGPRLLFGLLALQNGMISEDALLLAFHAWTQAKDRPMAEVMAAQGVISQPRRALLEALAAEHLAVHGGDPEKSLAGSAGWPINRESLARIGDPEIEATLGRVGTAAGSTENDADRTGTYAVGTTSADGQRFRILRPTCPGRARSGVRRARHRAAPRGGGQTDPRPPCRRPGQPGAFPARSRGHWWAGAPRHRAGLRPWHLR